jgi:hypothetical protein
MALLVVALSLFGFVGNASAELIGRGDNMVYDDVLNITWTRNADLPGSSNLTWDEANNWAADLVFEGFDDWRLPWASVTAGTGPAAEYRCTGGGGADEVACRDNEMAYMFYYNLDGDFFGNSETGTQTAVGGQVLTGIQPDYWSGTQANPSIAWVFVFDSGDQFGFFKDDQLLSAWAVRSGDVAAAIPEPASLLLFGLGALGLGWARRARRRR